MTHKEAEKAVHCFYNATENMWCEYKYDKALLMYKYIMYNEDGLMYQGVTSMDRILEAKDVWQFVGVL